MDKPHIGIRLNNPLNLLVEDPSKAENWVGLAEPPLVQNSKTGLWHYNFLEPKYGIRAASKTMQTYQEKRKIDTLAELIGRWAPPDSNPTDSYITAVSIRSGIDPDVDINVMDYDTAYQIIRSMARHENGDGRKWGRREDWYEEDVYEQGLRLAGVSPSKAYKDSRTTVATGTGIVASSTAVGILTDILNLPEPLVALLPQALTGFTEQQVAIAILVIVGLTQWRTIAARVDDKMKGRL